MTNNSRERAPLDSKRKKQGFVYQEVPNNEKAPGTTEKELGARWGLDEGASEQRGRATPSANGGKSYSEISWSTKVVDQDIRL